MAWLRGRFLARGSLSLAERPDPPRVRRARRGGAGPGRAARGGRHAAAWRVRRGRGVVTWKSAEIVGLVPAADRRRRRAPRARGAPGRAGAAGRAEPGPERRVGESPRAVGAAGRQLAAIDELEADGRLAGQPHGRPGRSRRPGARRPRRRSASWRSGSTLHRSAVQRALERIERLRSTTRHRTAGRTRRAASDPPTGSGIIRRCVPSSSPPTGRCTRRRPRPASWPGRSRARTA